MGLIATNEAECVDCYKCVRTCPVKAISITNLSDSKALHVQVLGDVCLKCGRCIEICPQDAKQLNSNDLDRLKMCLKNGRELACSVAPSFVSGVPIQNPHLMPTLLRQLGFNVVEETSVGAGLVSQHHLQLGFNQPLISSACPVVVNLIEIYHPELIPMLAPVVSPMIAHGRDIKKRHNDIRVAFIGPCVAKKDEYITAGISDAVDFVLGFDELWELVEQLGIDLANLTPSEFDNPFAGAASLYPLDGCMFASLRSGLDNPEQNYLAISGLEKCMEFLQHLATEEIERPPKLMELLVCEGGCINGPLSMCLDQSLYNRRQRVLDYYNDVKDDQQTIPEGIPTEQMYRSYKSKYIEQPLPSDTELRELLARTGKTNPVDELNCGACGYESCRDKAVAVYQGKAELEMCIPYMRKRAESLSNIVTTAMPNGIIIVDKELKILEMNPAAEKMFKCKAQRMVNESISQLLNPDNFIRALNSDQMINVCSTYPDKNIVVSEFIFPVERENIAVGIFVDITEEKQQREQFELVKNQTIMQAQEVIQKQMMAAQEIAGLLGEATAESKIQLSKLIKLMREDPLGKEQSTHEY